MRRKSNTCIQWNPIWDFVMYSKLDNIIQHYLTNLNHFWPNWNSIFFFSILLFKWRKLDLKWILSYRTFYLNDCYVNCDEWFDRLTHHNCVFYFSCRWFEVAIIWLLSIFIIIVQWHCIMYHVIYRCVLYFFTEKKNKINENLLV